MTKKEWVFLTLLLLACAYFASMMLEELYELAQEINKYGLKSLLPEGGGAL